MIATVGALVLAAMLAAGLAGVAWHQRRRAQRAEAEARRLRIMVGQTAHLAAWALRGEPAPPPPQPAPPQQQVRHLRSVQGVLWPTALAGAWEAARRHPQRVGAALASTVAAGLIVLPLIAPGDPQPDRLEPPAAASPPARADPGPPPEPSEEPDEPGAEQEPTPPGGEAPGPAPAEQPEMQRVAVTEPAPEPEPANPAPAPQPEPTPEPEPEPEPEPSPEPPPLPPEPPLPSPEPPPPSPAPEPEPPDDGDDGLICVDLELLALAELRLCLL